jgi:VanZ family protein
MLKFTVRQLKLWAVIYLLIITMLFFLPGSALPKEGWLDKIYFDKCVHFGFFALLLFLWRFYFPSNRKYHWLLLLAAFCYGLGVELIQHYFIENRSFDTGDVIADMAGAVAGIFIWAWYIKK